MSASASASATTRTTTMSVHLRVLRMKPIGRRGTLRLDWPGRPPDDSYWRKHEYEQNHSFPSRRAERVSTSVPQTAHLDRIIGERTTRARNLRTPTTSASRRRWRRFGSTHSP
jgi:hypothetical protein